MEGLLAGERGAAEAGGRETAQRRTVFLLFVVQHEEREEGGEGRWRLSVSQSYRADGMNLGVRVCA